MSKMFRFYYKKKKNYNSNEIKIKINLKIYAQTVVWAVIPTYISSKVN